MTVAPVLLADDDLARFLDRRRRIESPEPDARDLSSSLKQALDMVLQVLGARQVALYLDDPRAKLCAPGENKLTCVAAAGTDAAAQLGTVNAPSEGFLGQAYEGRRAVDLIKNGGDRVIAVPLVIGSSVCGVLVAQRCVSAPWALGLAEALSCFCAAAMARAMDEARARDAGRRDALTGLTNERFFLFRLREELLQAGKEQQHLSLLLVDVDRFAEVNATRGFWVGNRTLREIALLLERLAPRDAVIARVGGDAFGIVLTATTIEDAMAWGTGMRHALAQAPLFDDDAIGVTVSVGLAAFPEDLEQAHVRSDAASALIEVADRAMRRAKQRGGDRVVRE